MELDERREVAPIGIEPAAVLRLVRVVLVLDDLERRERVEVEALCGRRLVRALRRWRARLVLGSKPK